MRHEALVLDRDERLPQIGRNLVIGCPQAVFRTVNALIFQLHRRACTVGSIGKFVVINLRGLFAFTRNKQGFVDGRVNIIADIDRKHAGNNDTGDQTHQHQRHKCAENVPEDAPDAGRRTACGLLLLFEVVDPDLTLHVCFFHSEPLPELFPFAAE